MNPIPSSLRPGDFITCKKNFFICHVGVYLGNGWVLQNNPEKGEHVANWQGFCQGRQITIRHNNLPEHLVASRASELLNKAKPYHWFFNNCEHTASAVVDGFRLSVQVLFWGLLAFFLIRSLSRR